MHFGYCHFVIKYLMRDMMNYYCLRVFRSRLKKIGKHSPGFSTFRTEHVVSCSDAELCCVPIQSTVGAIFILGIHARQVFNEVRRFSLTASPFQPEVLEVQYVHLT